MANEHVQRVLAEKLRDGFLHPGDPEHDVPPTPILLPFRPPKGAPKEMADLMNGTIKLLTECIVAAIEQDADCEIVPRAEAATMRRAVGMGPEGPAITPVFCRCDTKRANPLALLTVTDPDAPIVIDGPTLLRGLHRRGVDCPHEVLP